MWVPTPVFLPGEFHGQKSLAGYIVHGVVRVGHNLVTKERKRDACALMITQVLQVDFGVT